MNSLPTIDPNSSHDYPSASPKVTLPDLLKSCNDGLENVPMDVLHQCVNPILEGLQRIDAESLLDLDRAADGAVLHEGVQVRPIHNQIKPSCSFDTVRYIHLAEVHGQYSMGIFIFPPYAKIPLHDHPGMCVLSRVLYGSLERVSFDIANDKSYSRVQRGKLKGKENVEFVDNPWSMDWSSSDTENSNIQQKSIRYAYKKRVDHLQAPDCTVLYPFEGNLHEFVAGPHGAAVLDVLFPPYESHDRDCTFYDIVGQSVEPMDKSDRQPCWLLAPLDQAEEFHCVSGRYQSLGAFD